MSRLLNQAGRPAGGQRGASLVIALIALLALTFAGLSMLRAVDTASLIAGNFAYRQATTSVADMAFEAALGDLDTVNAATTNTWDTNQPTPGTLKCSYYNFLPDAIDAGDNANGISKRVQDSSSRWIASTTSANSLSAFNILGSSYTYQCAIERMCQDPGAPHAITDANALQYCYSLKITDHFSLKSNVGPLDASNAAAKPFRTGNQYAYRVTVRIAGPRNTSALVQSVVLKSHTS